jgi:hypothetical protein
MKQPIWIATVVVFVTIAFLVARYGSLSGSKRGGAPAPVSGAANKRSESAETPYTTLRTQAPPATSQQETTRVFINGRELTRQEVTNLVVIYHYVPPAGRYWYDSRSGAWGVEGYKTAGFILPGHDFGPVAENASNGNTGVFVNGRELNIAEALNIQRSMGAVCRGHWWLDGRTGNFGVEGNPLPQGNISGVLRAQQSTRHGDNFWCSATACGNDNGSSGYVDVGGKIVGYDD